MDNLKIKTKRLLLVPLNKEYSKDMIKIWGDFDVIKYTNKKFLTKQKKCVEEFDNWIKLSKDNLGPNKFAILLNDRFIGVAGFPVIDNDNFKCGFFYQIIKEFWNKGYGFEVADALIKYIFEKHPRGEVIAGAVVNNIASIKILNKLGFTQTSIDKSGFKNNGLELDIVNFCLRNYVKSI